MSSNGTKNLPGGATFPGTYTDSDPGIHFNLYNSAATSYKAPGPAVWSEATGGSIGRVGIPGQGAVAQPTTTSVKTTAAAVTSSVARTTVAAVTTSATRVQATTVAPVTSSAPAQSGNLKAALYAQCGGVSPQ